jgi:hypothetical protein
MRACARSDDAQRMPRRVHLGHRPVPTASRSVPAPEPSSGDDGTSSGPAESPRVRRRCRAAVVHPRRMGRQHGVLGRLQPREPR